MGDLETDFETALAELSQVVPAGQACTIEQDIAYLVAAEFSLEARIDRAKLKHKPRRHLVRALKLAKVQEMAA